MSNQNQTEDVAQYLLRSIFQMHKRCEDLNKENKGTIKKGVIGNLARLKSLLIKIRKKGNMSIGFFGAQKRGKSTLINRLLGCDLMPTGVAPMTSAVVWVENDEKMPEKLFAISNEEKDGSITSHGLMRLEEARALLKEIVSHAGSQSPDVSKVMVSANFMKSKILTSGGVLVDTPGAECGFRGKGHRTAAEKDTEQDTKRAISALSQVQVVVFVERADVIESKDSTDLYSSYIHDMRPLCVVNQRDKYRLDKKEKKKIEDECKKKHENISGKEELCQQIMEETNKVIESKLKAQMITQFGASMDRTLCVVAKSKNDDGSEHDSKEWETSGLSELETKIVGEMSNLKDDKGLLICLKDLEKFLAQIREKDLKIAKDVFASGLTAMCVFICHVKLCSSIPPKAKDEIANIAKDLFVKYAPHGRKEYLEKCIQKECEYSDKLPFATNTGTASKVVSPEKSEDVKGDDHE